MDVHGNSFHERHREALIVLVHDDPLESVPVVVRETLVLHGLVYMVLGERYFFLYTNKIL